MQNWTFIKELRPKNIFLNSLHRKTITFKFSRQINVMQIKIQSFKVKIKQLKSIFDIFNRFILMLEAHISTP